MVFVKVGRDWTDFEAAVQIFDRTYGAVSVAVNRSNSTSGAVRVEANLPGNIHRLRNFYDKFIKKSLTLKIMVTVANYNIRSIVTFDGKYQPL